MTDSLEDAKELANEHWREQLAKCLVEVPDAAKTLASFADWLMERATHPANSDEVKRVMRVAAKEAQDRIAKMEVPE